MHKVVVPCPSRRQLRCGFGVHRFGVVAFLLVSALAEGKGVARTTGGAPPICAIGSRDAVATLTACLDRTASGGTIAVRPGRYLLRTPWRIAKPVTIVTAGLADDSVRCAEGADTRCATFVLAARATFPIAGQMPVEITVPHVRMVHLRFVGLRGRDRAHDQATCHRDRPAGGGLRISASDFSFAGSVLRDVICFTAMEATSGSDRLTVRNSFIGYNGTHEPGMTWSDGLTIHDGRDDIIIGNKFYDNTDVQLIFGGCKDCRVSRNRFGHSGTQEGSSFAELMVQSWTNTSGDFSGSTISRNRIDCRSRHRCGYGLMLGSNPWYNGRTFGGAVVDNDVRNAMIGLNVDGLTGPVTVQGNRVSASGGVFPSGCGVRNWPAVNVAAASRRWVEGSQIASGGVITTGCLLNHFD